MFLEEEGRLEEWMRVGEVWGRVGGKTGDNLFFFRVIENFGNLPLGD
jgi:hypothetical protein